MSEPAPEMTLMGLLDVQVCVPSNWNEDQVLAFAEAQYPCGTEHGWHIRQQGSKYLLGDPSRQPCAKRTGYVHIMLDA